MEILGLLKSFIYVVSSSLLVPVLIILTIFTFWILLQTGSVFAELLERIRLKKYQPEKLPDIIMNGDSDKYLSHTARLYLGKLKTIIKEKVENRDVVIENLLYESTLNVQKKTDGLKILIKIGPGVGLIGTLIPMGTGLANLGTGDMSGLTSNLVIAFTTTVVGLAVGLLAYSYYVVRNRWIISDINNMELATELLYRKSSDSAEEK